MSAGAWSRARHILAVRLDNLGDVLMTTPALRALRGPPPGRRITLLTSASGVEAAPFIPEVDAVIRYDAPWMKATRGDAPADLARVLRELASQPIDAAAIFTVYSQSPLPAALLCHQAGIPLRLAHCRENPYALLTDWVPESEPGPQVRHEVQRQLDLVARVGAGTADARLSFRTRPADHERLFAVLERARVNPYGDWIVVHPGATAPSRRYPPELYARALRGLAGAIDGPLLLTGSAAERRLVEQIRRDVGSPAISLAGRLGLGELGALIERAELLISNNTGPVHVAAAVGTPVVDLYALTNPQHTPWQVPHRVLYHDVPCRNCYKSVCPQGHHDCLRGVAPARVVRAARELLRGPRRSPSLPVAISA